MSDPTQAQPATPESPAVAQNTEPAQERMIPITRFNEVNEEMQALRKWKQEQEAAARAKTEQDAKDRGEWEKIAAQRQAERDTAVAQSEQQAARITALEAEMERQVTQMKKALPESMRDLVPDGDVLTRYTWLSKASAVLPALTPAAPLGTPAGPRGTGIVPRADADAASVLAQKRASGDYSL